MSDALCDAIKTAGDLMLELSDAERERDELRVQSAKNLRYAAECNLRMEAAERQLAAARAALAATSGSLEKLKAAIDGLRPYPAVVDAVACALVIEAERALMGARAALAQTEESKP